MSVFLSLGGKSNGDGFLVAPVGATHDGELSIVTDAGALNITLQAMPNAAGLVFSANNLAISTVPTLISVHALMPSVTRGDTTIQVLDGPNVVASYTLTAITHPKVHFSGRFEARFATDGAPYTRNPRYTAVLDTVVPPGWTWALEGEPDFVPAMGNIPENLETPVGRAIRLNNPAALRSRAPAVTSSVVAISGQTTTGTETFTAGDPIIGQAVNFGANTYFAGNNPQAPGEAKPEEYYNAAVEPLGLFELRFGALFSGGSQIGPFVAKSMAVDDSTRSPDSRPIANGLAGAAAELLEFGLPSLVTYSEMRIDELITDHIALAPGASLERRNLVRRIGHLLSRVSAAKAMAVQTANPGVFFSRPGTLIQGWDNKEVYKGKVDSNLSFTTAGSSVVSYLSEFGSFNFEWHPFAFHSDELCGHHKGHLTHLNADGSYSGDPHTRTVDGTFYDFQSVGEFTLLEDGDRFEIQVRQSPVATQNPIEDGNTGLKACVSVITAAAVRVGKHRISLQPRNRGKRLEFYVDGKAADLGGEGLNLDGAWVSAFDANGEMGVRVDLADQTVVTITPLFWNGHNTWYMNVSVSNTQANRGIMGVIAAKGWLPRLRGGESLGPMPGSLQDRYDLLYQKFAESWRISDATSLFVYEAGQSTKTFTLPDWPGFEGKCVPPPEFEVPGANVLNGMPVEKAAEVCRMVTEKDLNAACVFDVAATGDETFAEGYVLAQELRLYSTAVRLEFLDTPVAPSRVADDTPAAVLTRAGKDIRVRVTVTALMKGRPPPMGSVMLVMDGIPTRRAIELSARGVGSGVIPMPKPGQHMIRAIYSGGGRYNYHSSSSPSMSLPGFHRLPKGKERN